MTQAEQTDKGVTVNINWDNLKDSLAKFYESHPHLRHGMALRSSLGFPVWLTGGGPDAVINVDVNFDLKDLLLAAIVMQSLDNTGGHNNLFGQDVFKALTKLEVMVEAVQTTGKELATERALPKY